MLTDAFKTGFEKAAAKRRLYFRAKSVNKRHASMLNGMIKAKEGSVMLHYTKADGTKVKRRVTPYSAKKTKDGKYLVIGYDHHREAVRSFRMDSIKGMKKFASAEADAEQLERKIEEHEDEEANRMERRPEQREYVPENAEGYYRRNLYPEQNAPRLLGKESSMNEAFRAGFVKASGKASWKNIQRALHPEVRTTPRLMVNKGTGKISVQPAMTAVEQLEAVERQHKMDEIMNQPLVLGAALMNKKFFGG